MKLKLFTLLTVAAAFMASCAKESSVTPSLSYSGETIIESGIEGGIYTIEFDANTTWKASLDCDGSVAVLPVNKGDAQTKSIRVGVLPFNEKNRREFHLTLSVEGVDPVVITFSQTGYPYIVARGIEDGTINLPASGGEATFTIEATAAYTFTFDEGTMTGAKMTHDGDVFTISCAEQNLDKTTCSATFTMGEESITVTCVKEGFVSTLVQETIPTRILNQGGRYTLAKTEGKLIVCNGTRLYLYNEDMTFESEINFPAGVVFTGVASDDCGNIVASANGASGDNVDIYRLKAGDLTASFEKFVTWTNTCPGLGLSSIRARGDVYGDGIVAMFSASYAGTACSGVSWDITSGAAAQPVVTDVTFLVDQNVTSSNGAFFMPYGTGSAEGFLSIGYPMPSGAYHVQFYGSDKTWKTSIQTDGNGNYGYNTADIVTWGGKKVCAFIKMDYFGWDPCVIWIVDVTDPLNTCVICKYSYNGGTPGSVGNYTTDLVCDVVGDEMYVYFIDGTRPAWGRLKFSAL